MVAEKFPEATLVIAGPKSEALRPMADGGWRMVDSGGAADNGGRIADVVEQNQDDSKHVPCFATIPRVRILNLDDLAEGEKQDALAACDLLCVPSEGESFGMVYFEAWAYKKPVVALDLPVLRESVGAINGGLLVQDTPSEIANGIAQLLKNPALGAGMGANGNELASRHKWDASVEAYMQTYARIVATKA